MTSIYITITGARAEAQKTGPLTSGMVGVPVYFTFDPQWEGLNKIPVFRAGSVVKDNALTDNTSQIPHEVLQSAGETLYIGVEGRSTQGDLVIPTVWASAGRILSGAQATNNTSLTPTPSQFDRFMEQVEQVDEKMETALQQAKESGEFDGKDGTDGYTPVKGVDYFTEEELAAISQEAAQQVPDEIVFVTVDESTHTASHTSAQIYELVQSGKTVIARMGMRFYHMQKSMAGKATFICPIVWDAMSGLSGLDITGNVAQENLLLAYPDAVRYTQQSLSEGQKTQARQNIGVVPANWNAKEEEAGYVENRTHWAERVDMAQILTESTMTPDEDGLCFLFQPGKLIIGERYTVNWNGVEYICEAFDLEGIPALMNDGGNLETGEGIVFLVGIADFEIETGSGIYGLVAPWDGSASVTLSVYGPSETVHKLDSKYLDSEWVKETVAPAIDTAAENTYQQSVEYVDEKTTIETIDLRGIVTAEIGEIKTVAIDDDTFRKMCQKTFQVHMNVSGYEISKIVHPTIYSVYHWDAEMTFATNYFSQRVLVIVYFEGSGSPGAFELKVGAVSTHTLYSLT